VAVLPSTEDDADLDLVSIFETSDVNVVAILKLVFEDAGIEVSIRNETLQDMIYGRMGGFNPVVGPIQFWVRANDEEAARELIEETLEAPVEPPGAPMEELSIDAAGEALAEASDELQDATTQTSPTRRRWLRAVGAVTLNICIMPIFYISTGLILSQTAWGERHLSLAMWAGLAIALVFATATCIAWLTRPKLAAWLQALPLLPILWNLISQRTHESYSAGPTAGLKAHALPIIAAFFGALGVLTIASALLPRIISRISRR
jgi:hypothetical protein